MATFVSLATCHHFPAVSSRHGLVYKDSLSAFRSLRVPGCPRRPLATHLRAHSLHAKHHCRRDRPALPESIGVAGSEPPGGMRRLVVAQLRRLLTLGPTQPGPAQPG